MRVCVHACVCVNVAINSITKTDLINRAIRDQIVICLACQSKNLMPCAQFIDTAGYSNWMKNLGTETWMEF